jgi:hypothetical protein
MSCDTHKYGYALKGSSVCLYGSSALRQAQYFCYADWTGGLYTTPTLAGSRSGGLIAQCWASMVAVGRAGYQENARAILATARTIAQGVLAIPGLRLLGDAKTMVVCVAGAEATPLAGGAPVQVNIYSVNDAMTRRGWALNGLQVRLTARTSEESAGGSCSCSFFFFSSLLPSFPRFLLPRIDTCPRQLPYPLALSRPRPCPKNPACLHLCCTLRHVGREALFLSDLREAVEEVLVDPSKMTGGAAIYGMTASLPPGPVNHLLRSYNDIVLKV